MINYSHIQKLEKCQNCKDTVVFNSIFVGYKIYDVCPKCKNKIFKGSVSTSTSTILL